MINFNNSFTQINRIYSHRENIQYQRRASTGDMSSPGSRQRAGSRSANGLGLHPSQSEVAFHKMAGNVEKERTERERIVLWRQPLTTVQYFVLESIELFKALISK